MAMLSSCYYSSMRLYRDRPDILTPGSWHWCPPGAKPVPYLHKFGSFNSDPSPGPIDPPVGEVPKRRGKSAGRSNPRYTGQNVCGSEEVWTQGALYSQRGTPAVDADGVPICCQSLPAVPGGLVAEGSATWSVNLTGELDAGSVTPVGVRVAQGELDGSSVPQLEVHAGEKDAAGITLPGSSVSSGELDSVLSLPFGPVPAGELDGASVPPPAIALPSGELDEASQWRDTLSVYAGELDAGELHELTTVRTGELDAGSEYVRGAEGGEVDSGGSRRDFIKLLCSPSFVPTFLVWQFTPISDCDAVRWRGYIWLDSEVSTAWTPYYYPPFTTDTYYFYCALNEPFGWQWNTVVEDGAHVVGNFGTMVREYPMRVEFPSYGTGWTWCTGSFTVEVFDAQEHSAQKEGCSVPGPELSLFMGELESSTMPQLEIAGGEVGEADETEGGNQIGGGEVEGGDSNDQYVAPGELDGCALIDTISPTICSGLILPDTLHAIVSDVSGCSGIAGTYVITRLYPDATIWFGQQIFGGNYLSIQLNCNSGIGDYVWHLQLNDIGHDQLQDASSQSNDPFFIIFPTAGPGFTVCTGTFSVEITL